VKTRFYQNDADGTLHMRVEADGDGAAQRCTNHVQLWLASLPAGAVVVGPLQHAGTGSGAVVEVAVRGAGNADAAHAKLAGTFAAVAVTTARELADTEPPAAVEDSYDSARKPRMRTN
jgi:hypothetical protein